MGVLRGEVLPQVHCYRADDMANMIALADEMGFSIRSFHHALEAYKIRHFGPTVAGVCHFDTGRHQSRKALRRGTRAVFLTRRGGRLDLPPVLRELDAPIQRARPC